MSTEGDDAVALNLGPELKQALVEGSIVMVLGRDPDDARQMISQTFHLMPQPGRTRTLIACADIVRGLRQTADDLEAAGEDL